MEIFGKELYYVILLLIGIVVFGIVYFLVYNSFKETVSVPSPEKTKIPHVIQRDLKEGEAYDKTT